MRSAQYFLKEHKTCPTCQYEETRMDAPFCSYCGGKHALIIHSQQSSATISIPIEIDPSIPDGTFKLVSRKRVP